MVVVFDSYDLKVLRVHERQLLRRGVLFRADHAIEVRLIPQLIQILLWLQVLRNLAIDVQFVVLDPSKVNFVPQPAGKIVFEPRFHHHFNHSLLNPRIS